MLKRTARLSHWPPRGQQVLHQRWISSVNKASPEVPNRGISGPTKRTYILQFFLKYDITYLITDILMVVVIQSVFPLLPLGRYIYCHSPHWTDTKPGIVLENFFFIATSRSVSIVRFIGVSLVAKLLLNFVSIHWNSVKVICVKLNCSSCISQHVDFIRNFMRFYC